MSEIYFKPLYYFYLAAISLLASGLLLQKSQDWREWVFLIWSTFTGIFITYRFNDFIDGSKNYEFNLRKFFQNKLHLLVVAQLVLILTPLSLVYLSPFRFSLLAILGLLGTIYSIKFEFQGKLFRIKHVFILKNVLIGTCWGGLVILGADYFNQSDVLALFIFASVQVFIGSTQRDITDLASDSAEYVNSLPVVLGLKKTFLTLHFLNIVSFILPLFYLESYLHIIPFIITIVWRIFTLTKLAITNEKKWAQKYNLLTCFFIFIGQLIAWIL